MLGFGNPFSAPFWTDVEWGDIEISPPFLTFADRVTHFVDDLRVEVIHPGTPGHTTNDSVVWIPEHRVAFTGDLVFNGGTPFLLIGSPAGALDGLAMIRELGATTLVSDLGEFAGLTDPERIVGNLHRAYAELGGGERGALIDMRGALADMVTFNGGKPLTCHA